MKNRETEIGHLKLQWEGLAKDKENFKIKVSNLEIMIEQKDGYLKSYEETLNMKRSTIRTLDDVSI